MVESALPQSTTDDDSPAASLTGSGEDTVYTVERSARLAPFFMPIVTAGDGWGFVASTGALTVGRRSADEALFPYRTDDQLLDSLGTSASRTVLSAPSLSGATTSWSPWLDDPEHPAEESVAKSVLSDEVTLTHHRASHGIRLDVSWRFSRGHGWVRSTTLTSQRPDDVTVEVDDGVVNVLPPGAGARVQRELSTLLDSYKLTELDPASSVAWTRLNAALTDLAEPAESWSSTVMWSIRPEQLAVDIRPARRMPGGEEPPPTRTRGQRAAYRLRGRVDLPAGQSRSWHIVLDTGLDPAQVADLVALHRRLDDGAILQTLQESWQQDRARLAALVASADGFHQSADLAAGAHHTSSVVFNLLRGGVPARGLTVDRQDLSAFLRARRSDRHDQWGEQVGALPPTAHYADVRDLARRTTDPDLRRLLREYLPLTFSRRHGDPSRPWNAFAIAVTDAQGAPVLRYEGNWRDIIQNWEALAWSFPPLLDSMITIVLNAMTVDGYNPYRISTHGVDWEVPEPENPWSNIGYWSDHQVTYLHQLLRLRRSMLGDWTPTEWLAEDYVYADVPYRLGPWREVLAGTADMVTFEEGAHDEAMKRSRSIGGDGRLRWEADGHAPVRAGFLEKLLVIAAAKAVLFVPGAGVWMNTQRPEWNDANNALVGRGVSLVTAAQLRPFSVDLRDQLTRLRDDHDVREVRINAPLARLVRALTVVLEGEHTDGVPTDTGRARAMARLGAAADAFHADVHSPALSDKETVAVDEIVRLLDALVDSVDEMLAAGRTPEGLYTSYSVLEGDDDALSVRPLGPMLEGQVNVIASGALAPAETLDLIEAVRASRLRATDRDTYLLYPDREVDGLLHRAAVPDAGHEIPLLRRLVASGDRRLVAAAQDGRWYFGGALRNAKDVAAVLDDLAADPSWAEVVRESRAQVLAVFEESVDHAAYTGRSGTFFAYEGLGSVYWHMVAKYLNAIQLAAGQAQDAGERQALLAAAEEVRGGLLHRRTPEQVGAITIDPHSHTPSGGGARQPGMTGAVKEDIVIRWRDLGVTPHDRTWTFSPECVAESEWLREPTAFVTRDADGRRRDIELPSDSVGFTLCQVPVIYRRGESSAELEIRHRDGSTVRVAGTTLPPEVAAELRERRGTVLDLTVRVP